MATATKKAANSSASKPQEATALLRADHKAVSALFEGYEKSRSVTKKDKELVVKEEQNEMFPKVKQTKLDPVALVAQMAARKAELLASGDY